MIDIDVSIALPEDETSGELIKGYFTLMRAFGWDLYVTSHFVLRESLGAQWFASRISELKDSAPKFWPPNQRFDPQDPGVILRDYIHEHDSPFLGVFGEQYQMKVAARKILATRNTWFHFGDDPTTAQLEEAAKVVRGFVQSGNMQISGRIEKLLERLSDLRTGRYPADAVSSSPAMPSFAVETQTLNAPDDLPRPSIGGTWVGPIPTLRYRMTRAGDVVHPETLESVRSQVDGDFAEKVRAWTAVEPRGREVWIDTDGAIGGYVGPAPRLLGYLGADPEGDIARGFFTSHFYTVDGVEVVDLDTGERIKAPFAEGLTDGVILRVTTYGDVIVLDEADSVERVATVTPAEWFPGQLV